MLRVAVASFWGVRALRSQSAGRSWQILDPKHEEKTQGTMQEMGHHALQGSGPSRIPQRLRNRMKQAPKPKAGLQARTACRSASESGHRTRSSVESACRAPDFVPSEKKEG